MIAFLGELFGLIAEGFFLSHATKAERRGESVRSARKEQVRAVLTRIASALGGVHTKPWFRAPRVFGHHEGREVELLWLGKGKVEVRCRARGELDVSISESWLDRLLGRGPRVAGANQELAPWARELYTRFGLTSLSVQGGALVARGRPENTAVHLTALCRSLVDLAWSSEAGEPQAASPSVVVSPREPTVAVATRAPAELRCPFCHDDLEDDAPVVHCAACDAPHHPSCFEEGAGCSIAGCQERRAKGRRGRA